MRHHAVSGSGRVADALAPLLALVGRPLEPTDRVEPLDELVVQREEVLDVGGRVDALLGAQRAARPVGEPVALGEPRAEQPLDRRGQRRCPHAR